MIQEIERLRTQIKTVDKKIERLPSLSLGMLLEQCSYGSLRDKIDKPKEYRVGTFGFSVYAHDTGNSVVVNLYAPDGDKLEIINKTYWHNESQYGHNKYVYIRGAWDDALSKAIESIREGELKYQQSVLAEAEARLAELFKESTKRLDKFNSMFS